MYFELFVKLLIISSSLYTSQFSSEYLLVLRLLLEAFGFLLALYDTAEETVAIGQIETEVHRGGDFLSEDDVLAIVAGREEKRSTMLGFVRE